MKVNLFTDGAARGNPDGPGGYGCILQYTDAKGNLHEREFSGGFARTTNNRMELLAAIVGLEALIRPCEVDLFSDSAYLINAFNQHWIESWIRADWLHRGQGGRQPVKNQDLWKRLLAAMEHHTVHFHWVKGHTGHPLNERCDRLATSAADSGNLPEDPGAPDPSS